ncbi:hypothetical protein [Mycolicibacterium llatzerense]|uniref:hypothetical protein n=1 Tax=Mycolicibacterium llatzerense TaxID=280871 RepID=UPI0013A6C292|nr:hypothetical protein [Mycolicibacterium llatzerense]
MRFQDFGNGLGPQHVVAVPKDAEALSDASPFGETEELPHLVCAPQAELPEFRRGRLATPAELREADIARLAAVIREVDGDHSMGAAALAEALIDRGISFRSEE